MSHKDQSIHKSLRIARIAKRKAEKLECDRSSVTAEINPHFRPAVWDRFDSNACTSPHVTNIGKPSLTIPAKPDGA